jgi:hypothetical protein
MTRTAVEWFFGQSLELTLQLSKRRISHRTWELEMVKISEQAKEMEKEQHQETFKQSRLAKVFEKDMPPVWESWEQYYNETFKNKYI